MNGPPAEGVRAEHEIGQTAARPAARSGSVRAAAYWHLRLEIAESAVAMTFAVLEASKECTGWLQSEANAGRLTIDAYFGVDLGARGFRRIAERSGALAWQLEVREEEDWLATYRALAQPIRVGGFVLDPREPVLVNASLPASGTKQPAFVGAVGAAEPVVLRLPIRRAFGTGSHATTRLMIRCLETIELSGRSVLDVGTGTGVLCFVAACRGARQVVGFDLDPTAALLALENKRWNGNLPQFFAGDWRALRSFPAFDVLLCNVLPDNLGPVHERLARLLRPGARALIGGLIAEETDAAVAAWREQGLFEVTRRSEDEWLVVELRHADQREQDDRFRPAARGAGEPRVKG